MIVRRTRLLVPVGIATVVAATALSGTTGAAAAGSVAAVAAAGPTRSNGLIAYTCRGIGVSTKAGWVLSTLAGPVTGSPAQWQWGTYSGGVDWAPDGSEMAHDATADTDHGFPNDSTHTVFTSEASQDPTHAGLGFPFDYPQQDTNFDNTPAIVDSDTTFTADGRDILFTRTTGGHSTIEDIPAAGWDPPIDLTQPAGDNSQPTASANGDIAFVNVAATGPNAGVSWVWVLLSGSSTPAALQPGTHPKFSPSGSVIGYVNGAGTLSTMTTAGGSVTAVGPSAYGGPTIRDFAWSPDSTTFVVGLSNNTVQTAPVTAGSALTALPLFSPCSALGEHVSWQPVPTTGNEDQVVRVWGATRQDTSVAASKAGFPTPGSADAVVLADSYHFPDALSGAPLATFVHGPMLLTPGSATTIFPSVKTELDRVLGSKSKPIYVLGQTGSVSAGIAQQLTDDGYTVTRLGGANRYDTSLAIANFMGAGATAPEELMLATGTDFPDGLSAGAAAASYWPGSGPGGAVLLTNGNKMYGPIQSYITAALAAQTPSKHVYVTTVGGLADKAYPGTLSNPKFPAVGATRYDTSASVAYLHFGAQTAAAVATGTSFPDALSGGAYAGSINAPLLLIPPSLVSAGYQLGEVPYYLNTSSGSIAKAYVFGGTGVVNTTQASQLAAVIGVNTTSTEITPTTVLNAKARSLLDMGHATPKRTPQSIVSRTATQAR